MFPLEPMIFQSLVPSKNSISFGCMTLKCFRSFMFFNPEPVKPIIPRLLDQVKIPEKVNQMLLNLLISMVLSHLQYTLPIITAMISYELICLADFNRS
jgi:hypothetical protein